MILISAFLTGYVLLFRRSLKFPNVFVLFPLAMSAIWLLNSLRIALLVFIGANLSPAIALGGFHSQFGWISFLLIAITIMTSAQRIAFFATEPSGAPIGRVAPRPDKSTEWNPALLYLAPFVALLAGQILASAASPRDYLLYPIKVLAIGSVLYALRHAYARIWSPPALSSLLFGGIAGLIWIATDPGVGAGMPLETSLSELTPIAFVAWLVFRAVGTVVMVPVAEELAFRGYFYRVMFSSRFETVDFRSFGFVALVLSAGLFGLMHDRWLAASLAGLLYGLVMIRSGRISDAIAAHMTTNAVIFAWAVAAGQWSLL
jgi:exosortase E/protease (VPEID-CTERM system)